MQVIQILTHKRNRIREKVSLRKKMKNLKQLLKDTAVAALPLIIRFIPVVFAVVGSIVQMKVLEIASFVELI